MFDADRGRRVAMMEPLLRDAFEKVSKVVRGMGEGGVAQTPLTMANDGAQSFIWECIEVRAWDRYEAGGPLEAEDAELTVSPELSELIALPGDVLSQPVPAG
jgi:hypothetical protein